MTSKRVFNFYFQIRDNMFSLSFWKNSLKFLEKHLVGKTSFIKEIFYKNVLNLVE